MRISLLTLCFIFLSSCGGSSTGNSAATSSSSTAVNLPPMSSYPTYYPTFSRITDAEIDVAWDKIQDPEQEALTYDIKLGDENLFTKTSIKNTSIKNLTPQTNYDINVFASDPAGNTTHALLTLTTLPAGESVSLNKINVENLTRQYAIFKPNNPNHEIMPVVIILHGAGGYAWPAAIYDYWVTIARREHFIFVMPQALVQIGNTYPSWAARFATDASPSEQVTWSDVLFINKVLDELISQDDVDANKIYLAGMSSGGYMTFFAAQDTQDRLAAVASISGSLAKDTLGKFALDKPLPLLKMHGTADTVVPMYNTDVTWDDIFNVWSQANKTTTSTTTELSDINKTDSSTVTLIKFRGDTIASDIDFYRINNGGHSVPGIEGEANQDINAYEVIWEFFKNHQLSDR